MAIDNKLNILSEDKIRELYGIPKLESEDREEVFDLMEEDLKYLKRLKRKADKVNYILQLGYFRANRYFYTFNIKDVEDDIIYINERYFSGTTTPKRGVSKTIHYKIQQIILKNTGYKRYNKSFKGELKKQSKRVSKRDISKEFIFEEVLKFCEYRKVLRPAYSVVQEIISESIQREEKRIIRKLDTLLSKNSKASLDAVLEQDDFFYKFTFLKKEAKNFRTSEIYQELKRQSLISNVYEEAKVLITDLKISKQNIKYYSELAEYYSIDSLTRMENKKVRMLLFCYIWQKYIKINDRLITYFIHKNELYNQEAEDYAENCILKKKIEFSKDRQSAAKILKIIHNHKINAEDIRRKSYEVVEEKNFKKFIDRIFKSSFDSGEYKWQYYSEHYGSIKLNLRRIFLSISYKHEENSNLKEAIGYFRKLIKSNKKFIDQAIEEVPLKHIKESIKKYLIYKKEIVDRSNKKKKRRKFIDIKRYEIALYQEICNELSSGKLSVIDSINYRNLDDELIPKEVWEKEKKAILASVSDCIDLTPINKLLSIYKKELENLYRVVNKRIKSKENKDIKIDKDNLTWKIPYKGQQEKINNPFYEKLEVCSIVDVIKLVEEKVSFLKSFIHILNTSSKSKASIGSLSAYLVSQGSGIGKKQMAESSDISIDDLNGVERKFIRIKTLDKACNEIINEIAKLRIFKDYNLSDYGIHASLDGQKIETRYQTIMARYSKKYFGTKKGVVSYSLIANHLPVVTKIIGANEHESHYVLDLVYNNKSDLDIKAISGDMHSINRVNFFFLRMFNYDFMPRFTKFNIRAENNLVGFKKLSSYSKYLIKPIKKIKIDNIIKEWDNVLRILASLALKETTQSVIISKLSSCRKINTTLKALIEFNNIIMSVYMLKYIDDSKIRQSVYRALNRGESFHQIRSAILKISGRKLQGKKDLELEVSNQCNRLLACCIIYYNTAILSELLEIAEQLGNKKLCKGIKRLSPVAWQHINMIGKFEFFVKKESLNIGEIVNDLMENSEDILVAA